MSPDDEARVATFFATPTFKAIRHLIEGLSLADIDEIVERVRAGLWRDFSGGSQARPGHNSRATPAGTCGAKKIPQPTEDASTIA